MSLLAQISDLHFGREDPQVAKALLADLRRAEPALVAVSGDLTQRARRSQFRDARAFLDRLPAPWLAVPGNHDIPLYNILRRTFVPLRRYKRYMTEEVAPFVQANGFAVLGLNSARSLALKEGRLSLAQIASIPVRLREADEAAWRIVVTHHPFLEPREHTAVNLVGRSRIALKALAASGVAVVLAGHAHLGYHGLAAGPERAEKDRILVVQSGTSTSTRRRGEPNSYNLLERKGDVLRLEVRAWNGDAFEPRAEARYRRTDERWEKLTEK